ncbi:hypothetical protein F5X68DRAFT_75206 [Plectosphaerella plurivora]|uniref:Uncharacterized protein n=1 Tax=Plectosphaerella plurivora TaxID=936078 RepID=A0A9P8VET1_9PEZI|nr:hypothetical protein F5X68DRAFT_75206 [Plectosphaerella plurivora]
MRSTSQSREGLCQGRRPDNYMLRWSCLPALRQHLFPVLSLRSSEAIAHLPRCLSAHSAGPSPISDETALTSPPVKPPPLIRSSPIASIVTDACVAARASPCSRNPIATKARPHSVHHPSLSVEVGPGPNDDSMGTTPPFVLGFPVLAFQQHKHRLPKPRLLSSGFSGCLVSAARPPARLHCSLSVPAPASALFARLIACCSSEHFLDGIDNLTQNIGGYWGTLEGH